MRDIHETSEKHRRGSYATLVVSIFFLILLVLGYIWSIQSPKQKTFNTFISFGEGSWPIEEYADIDSDIMDIHFEYPVGWKGNIKSDIPNLNDEENPTDRFGYASDDDYISTGLFMEIAIRRYYKPARGEGFQPFEPKEGAKTILIGGITCDDSDCGIDPETGNYRRSLLGRNKMVEIRIVFSPSSGRTAEEYREVTDRFLESFEINFEKY